MKPYTIGLYEKAMPNELSWTEKLITAKEAEFDYVEISIDESAEKINRIYMTKEERLNLIKKMYATGIPIRSMCVSALTKDSLGNSSAALCDKGKEIPEKCIALADDLGVRIVMIPAYYIYYGQSTQETQQKFIENLKKAIATATRYGVVLKLKTMENSFMNAVWKAMYYVKQIDFIYLEIYPDCGNMKNAAVSQGSDVIQDLMSGRGHITSLHLKETTLGKFREGCRILRKMILHWQSATPYS